MENLWKNNLKVVQDVPMIYANFITAVITVSEGKRIGRVTVVPPLVYVTYNQQCYKH